MFSNVQSLVLLGLWVVFLGLKAFAFVDCIRRPAQAFPAIGRKSKVLWLILTGVSAATALIPGSPLGLIGIAGLVVALIYLFDVRPKIIEILTRRW
jgi:hypothetical protein